MWEKITVRVRKKLIGLVEIKGIILSSAPYTEEIKRFAKVPGVRAILLRIDTPGGAVVPSQEIYDAVRRAREKKPVVVSMGSVAASGGYLVASAAEKIYASPGTLTGSIGVAMHLRNVQQLLGKVGIANSIIKSGQFKDVGSPYRKMLPREEEYLQNVSDDIYNQFVDAVADGRGISPDEAKKLADGRIYTGKKALELGLVDAIGGLQEAIRETGKSVGIKAEPNIVSFRRKRRLLTDYFARNQLERLFFDRDVHTAGASQGWMLVAPFLGG